VRCISRGVHVRTGITQIHDKPYTCVSTGNDPVIGRKYRDSTYMVSVLVEVHVRAGMRRDGWKAMKRAEYEMSMAASICALTL
jgi:hypothetical protein